MKMTTTVRELLLHLFGCVQIKAKLNKETGTLSLTIPLLITNEDIEQCQSSRVTKNGHMVLISGRLSEIAKKHITANYEKIQHLSLKSKSSGRQIPLSSFRLNDEVGVIKSKDGAWEISIAPSFTYFGTDKGIFEIDFE